MYARTITFDRVVRDLEYFSKMYPGSTNDDILPGIYLIIKFKKVFKFI